MLGGGICRPLAGCKPIGVMIGAMVLSGIILVIIGAVGLYSFTPSDLLQQYNDAVQAWGENGITVFKDNDFLVCRSTKEQHCSPLRMLTNSTEGEPPGREYNTYQALTYKTDDGPGLLRNRVAFECDNNTVMSVTLLHKKGNISSEISTPILVPVFAWKATDITDETTCDNQLGLFWKNRGISHCFNIFVLNRICITVNKTKSKWGIEPFQKNTEAGCSTNPNDLVGCGHPVSSWGYGGYSLVDGNDISKQIIHNKGGPSHEVPTTLPKSRWYANLSVVSVTVRSIYDPILNSEVSTNGTLDFDKESSGQYAFSGNLVGFTGWSIFMVGLTIGTTPVLVVIMIAILLPQLRFKYLYKSQHPDNFTSFINSHNHNHNHHHHHHHSQNANAGHQGNNNNINGSSRGKSYEKFTFPPAESGSGSGSYGRSGSSKVTPRS